MTKKETTLAQIKLDSAMTLLEDAANTIRAMLSMFEGHGKMAVHDPDHQEIMFHARKFFPTLENYIKHTK